MNPEAFQKWMEQLDRVLRLVKWLAGLASTCAVGMIAVVIWVNNTTGSIVATQQRVEAVSRYQEQLVRDWTPWRAETDRNVTRILIIQEAQQKLIERLNDKMDRRP